MLAWPPLHPSPLSTSTLFLPLPPPRLKTSPQAPQPLTHLSQSQLSPSPPPLPSSATHALLLSHSLRNQQKKLLRKQAYEREKPERRARERAAKKDKAAEKRKLVELGVIERPVDKRRAKNGPKTPYGARIVIDVGFDDKMTDKVRVFSFLSSLRVGGKKADVGFWREG